MMCRACSKSELPPNFLSERRCAFLTGEFSGDNWNCETMCLLRDRAEEGAVYAEDEWASVFAIHNSDRGPFSPLDIEFVMLHWYKRRGRTSTCLVYDGTSWHPPSVGEADWIAEMLSVST